MDARQVGRAAEASAAAERAFRILVVDDVFDNRDILTRRLVRRGFEVIEACSGTEALAKLGEMEFDLLLLDIMMPDLSGNDVLRTIRQTRSALELPIIMVTAKSHSEDVVESLELGANDYVTKPVDFAVALARINAQLARKQAADADARTKREAEERAAASALALVELADGHRITEQQLRFLAYHDGLTKLLNRTAFRDNLNETLHDPDRIALDPAVVFIDLDRFKAVNDAYGHEIGDRLLAEAAARLKQVVGDGAVLARLGGDEFGILLPDPGSSDAAHRVAEQAVEALRKPFVLDGQQFQVGGSGGLAMASDCGSALDTIVKAADLAMYRAKCEGRGRVVRYDRSMLDALRERSALEADLRQAIHSEALDIVYQPVINADTRHVTAFEALVRWNHPVRGMLLPDAFIQIAEESGLIVPLGHFVLRRACAEAKNWPEEIRVAVNLSPLQFRNNDLIPMIEEALAESGLDPSRLELEITESALLEAGKHNLDILRRIRLLGIRVSMDDFGTGYSSMSYLQNFDFDKIKIDRRFVQGLKPGQNGAAIIKAIAELGTGCGIALIAEGVETDEELEILSSFGCTEIQGFLFSRPLASEDTRAFIENSRAMISQERPDP